MLPVGFAERDFMKGKKIFWYEDETGIKSIEYKINGAKARNIRGINCPDLKVGAIEKQSITGLLPQASLRGAQNLQF